MSRLPKLSRVSPISAIKSRESRTADNAQPDHVSTVAPFLVYAGVQLAVHTFRWLRRRAEDREIRETLENVYAAGEAEKEERRKRFQIPTPPVDPRDVA